MQTGDNKKKKRKAVLIGLGIAATGVAGYFGWQYLRQRKSQGDTGADFSYQDTDYSWPADTGTNTGSGSNSPGGTSAPIPTDSFPLKKGSRGPNVKALQDALIASYGASILPKYGADGDFGSETEAALKKAGLPIPVTPTVLNVLAAKTTVPPEQIAADIYQSILARDFDAAMTALGKIRNTEEYRRVSEIFKIEYRVNLVRQTVVNALLTSFSEESQKQSLRLAFTRIGLSYDGSKWSLDGIGGYSLLTTRPTKVWLDASSWISVPERIVLGRELLRRNDYSLFEQSGKTFLVPTADVRYL